jgi:hypothetical protein
MRSIISTKHTPHQNPPVSVWSPSASTYHTHKRTHNEINHRHKAHTAPKPTRFSVEPKHFKIPLTNTPTMKSINATKLTPHTHLFQCSSQAFSDARVRTVGTCWRSVCGDARACQVQRVEDHGAHHAYKQEEVL